MKAIVTTAKSIFRVVRLSSIVGKCMVSGARLSGFRTHLQHLLVV